MTTNPADRGSAISVRSRSTRIAYGRALARQAERAMARASDAPPIPGNTARLLVDGPAAFEAWLDALAAAEHYIHLENYIIRADRSGRRFRDVLMARARGGVKVRVLYDWLGCWATPRSFWGPLRDAGVEVLPFGPPSLRDPLGMLRRNHRKVLVVDGDYGSVAGMCIGDDWAGIPEEGVPPWRDTGVELRGPVVRELDAAFRATWTEAGGSGLESTPPIEPEVSGNVSVRVVAGEPGRSRIYRLSQLVAVGVVRRLWITDPYFVAPPAMVESLAATARDGVDVRIIVPAYNNWPVVGGMSRAGYRPLLEAGVRLFEWEGPMIHAKTAVADGVWSRVGSSNLNLASLLGNWELDVAILDPGFAGEMEALFERDMENSVEVCLPRHTPTGDGRPDRRAHARQDLILRGVGDEARLQAARAARERARRGSPAGRLLGRLSRASSVLGRALIGHRTVGREDSGWVAAIGVVLVGLGVLGFFLPTVLAWPVALVLFWLGIAAALQAIAAYQAPAPRAEERPGVPPSERR
jgi:cardiolipin synthase A/B